jgi:HK97 family phage major capsid protein
MSIQQLQIERREKGREARAIMRSIKDNTPETEARAKEREFDALLVEMDELEERIDEMRMEAGDPRRPRGADTEARGVAEPENEHVAAFSDWLRRPHSEAARSQLTRTETRSASGLTGAAGGFVVPEQIVTPIMARARDLNPFRRLVRVVNVTTGDVKFPLSEGDATSGWVGETDTRSATTEPTLANKTPTFGTAYANVIMTEELAMDAAIDIQSWFEMECGRAMAEAEMNAIISGDGDDKPTGLLDTAPESAADGSRTANALRYIASGAASTLGTDPGDLLMDTYYDLKAQYRANATWVMNSATAATVRKLKDGDGRYLWADGLSAGQPPRLLGHPVAIAEGMDDIGTNALPIMFGDFQMGYILAQRTQMTVLTDPYTTKGSINVYLRYRVGGITYDENAVRVIKCAAS